MNTTTIDTTMDNMEDIAVAEEKTAKRSRKKKEMPTITISKTKMVKVLIFTFQKNLEDLEESVNQAVIDLAKKGCKVCSIVSFETGNAPIRIVYNLIYECDLTVEV